MSRASVVAGLVGRLSITTVATPEGKPVQTKTTKGLTGLSEAGLERHYSLKRAPSLLSIWNGVIHDTPTASQASGILIFFLDAGSGFSCVITV